VPVRELTPGSIGTAHTLVATLPRGASVGQRVNVKVSLTASGPAQGDATAAARIKLVRAAPTRTAKKAASGRSAGRQSP
jgi:hypothetical protein